MQGLWGKLGSGEVPVGRWELREAASRIFPESTTYSTKCGGSRISPRPSAPAEPGWGGQSRKRGTGPGPRACVEEAPSPRPGWAGLGRAGLQRPGNGGLVHGLAEGPRQGRGAGVWERVADSRPWRAGGPSPWAGGGCRWVWWAGAAPAARPAAWPAPDGWRAARPPGPSTAGRCGCGQRGAVRAVLGHT